MVFWLHGDSTEEYSIIAAVGSPFLVQFVGAFDDRLVGVEVIEFAERGVDGEEDFEAVVPAGDILFASCEAATHVVGGQTFEVLAREEQVGQLVWLVGHHNILSINSIIKQPNPSMLSILLHCSHEPLP